MHLCVSTCHIRVCIHGRVYRLHTCAYKAFAIEFFLYFLALLLKSCAPDPGGRQGGDYVVTGCTWGCRYDSFLCGRCGMSTYSNRRPPHSCVVVIFLNILSRIKTPVIRFNEILSYVQSRNNVPLLILFIIYMYFVRNDEQKMANQSIKWCIYMPQNTTWCLNESMAYCEVSSPTLSQW